MCGIVAALAPRVGLGRADLEARASRMAAAIAHRGPDADGVWSDAAAGLVFGHRRLSVVDLSPAGAQPMSGGAGRFVIVFNGEIYNHGELRRELAGHDWRGHSDTEVLLAAVAAWGLEAALRRCVGMFAFALWDTRERTLTLARDRIGEKPLYYGVHEGVLLVASELKALRAWPGWQGEIDRSALDDFLRRGCVHAPRSIFSNVRKLPAATFLTIAADRAHGALDMMPRAYWSLAGLADNPDARESDDGAVDRLEHLLGQSIGRQMVADVPVGAFLSGGIDSSLVVALMQRQSHRPVRTYSIGFHEEGYDEAQHARAVAAHLGTEHTDLYLSPAQAQDVIPLLPGMYDEPFGDSSQVPTFLVSRLARRDVTVSLSGDGGDELFGGYNRYLWAEQMWRRLSRVPRPMRQVAGRLLQGVSPASWDRLWHFMPGGTRVSQPGDKLHKLGGVAAMPDTCAAYDWLISQYREVAPLVQGVAVPTDAPGREAWAAVGLADAERMMLADALGYLPDDIMVKVDRAAMAVSLETRAPFLDHHVVEFAFRLPLRRRIRTGRTKWLLRELLDRHVPRALVERPKMGFGIPIDQWLRGPLRDWASSLLEEGRLREQGLLHTEPVARAWREHQSGRRNHQHFLWNVLMFQSWAAAFDRS